MKQLSIGFILCSMLLVGCLQSTKIQMHENVKAILIDPHKGKQSIDISYLFEDDLDIVKLETTQECLVTANGKKLFTENGIFISDDISQKISMFDASGKFVRSIGQKGNGPGEYVELGDFTIRGDSLYVQDAQRNKIIVYPVLTKGFRDMALDPDIYYDELMYVGNKLYFITNYSSPDEHYNNLIEMNPDDNSRRYFLPFDKQIQDQQQAWGINRHAGRYKDSTLLLYARNDTLYNLVENQPTPCYVVQFTDHNVPEDLMQEDALTIRNTALQESYIVGLNEIYNMKAFMIFSYGEGSKSHTVIYEKRTGNMLDANTFVFNDLGGLPMSVNIETTDNDELIIAYDPILFLQIWNLSLCNNQFRNPKLKEKMKAVAERLNEDDNPVFFKIRFKSQD